MIFSAKSSVASTSQPAAIHFIPEIRHKYFIVKFYFQIFIEVTILKYLISKQTKILVLLDKLKIQRH